jgi:hypothetical protein
MCSLTKSRPILAEEALASISAWLAVRSGPEVEM